MKKEQYRLTASEIRVYVPFVSVQEAKLAESAFNLLQAKKRLKAENERLRKGIEELEETALQAVDHVGLANYGERQKEARGWIRLTASLILEGKKK